MHRMLRFATALGSAVLAAGCMSAAEPPAGTGQTSQVAPALAFVFYQGGPVLVNPKLYLIFWGYKRYGDPDKVEPLLTLFAQNMGGSPHNNIYTQYYEVVSSNKVYITNAKDEYGGAWDDESVVPKSPTDQQVAAEALRSVTHFKYDPNGLYLVATPHGHSSQGFGTTWCAYHSYTYYDKKELLPYDNFPYMPDASGNDCGKNWIKPPSDESGIDEGITIMAGHEFGEGITDPKPYTGWTGTSGEIGDYCAWHGIANDHFRTKAYTSQPMLSDATHSCVQAYK